MTEARRNLRRFAPVALVLGVAGLFWLQSRHAPVEVEASYVLSGNRAGIETMTVRWQADGGKTVEAEFRYHGRKVPRLEHQTLQLPPDDYTVAIAVTRANGTARTVEHRVQLEQQTAVELTVSLDP